MPNVGTREQLKDYMMGIIAEIGRGFTDPEDDWAMVAALEDSDGQLHLAPLDNEMFANDHSKDILAAMLKDYIKKTRIVNYAILFNVHGVAFKTKEEMEEAMKLRGSRRLSTLPGAVEMLMLIVGNEMVETSYQAKISRDGKSPPTLGEWKEITGSEGRFSHFNEGMGQFEI